MRSGRRRRAPLEPALRAFYDRLRARSKQTKVALVAVMRKRIALADALLRANRL